MPTMLAGMIGGWEVLLVVTLVMLVFGANKVPALARSLGQSIKEFKNASREPSKSAHNNL